MEDRVDRVDRVDSVACRRFGYKEIARGAEKIVYIRLYLQKREKETTQEQEKVYYAPVTTALVNREKDLREEKAKMDHIAGKLEEPSPYLALEAKEITGAQRVDGKYTLELERATGNLEKEIQKDISLEQRIKFGRNYLRGLKDLHQAGFAYGDSKAENCLIYGNRLKISDFGKAQEIGNREEKYTGNTRFASPEGTLSKKGDVYGGALILIRIFEEQYLNEDQKSLLKPSNENIDIPPSEQVRGVERYIVHHKAFPGCESKGVKGKIRSISRRVSKMGSLSQAEKRDHEIAIHLYISALKEKMIEKSVPSEKANKFAELLCDITKSKPSERPIMDEVALRYNQIFPE